MRKTYVTRHTFTQDIETDYDVGDVLEGPVRFPGMAAAGGALFSATMYNTEALTPVINLHFFSGDIINDGQSAGVDNQSFVLDPLDSPFLIATIQIATWLDISSGKVAVEKNINVALPGNKARDLFMIAELRTKHRPDIADALRLILGIRR